MTEINSELFFDVADYIRKHPENYNQQTWANKDSLYDAFMNAVRTSAVRENVCGSNMCVCGTGVFITDKQLFVDMTLYDATFSLWYEDVHYNNNHKVLKPWQRARINKAMQNIKKFCDKHDIEFDPENDGESPWETVGQVVFGLEDSCAADFLFAYEARPTNSLTVPEALEKIGAGAQMSDVWSRG